MGLLSIGGILIFVGGMIAAVAFFAFVFSSDKKSSNSDKKDDTLL